MYKECIVCGNGFITKDSKNKYCSEECRKIGYAERYRRFKEKYPNYMKEYSEKRKAQE